MNFANTSFNKSVYGGLFTAAMTVFLVFAPDMGITLTSEKAAAVNGLVLVLINLFVPNNTGA